MFVKHAAVNVVLGVFISLAYTGSVLAAPVSYAPPVSTSVATASAPGGDNPEFIAKGDLDGVGGINDLVTVNTTDGTVTVLLRNGTGVLTANDTYTVGTEPRQIAIGDLDGNGYNDLVIPNTGSGNVTIYLNVNGTFTEALESPIALGGIPTSPVIADFNGGSLDIAISDASTNSVHILFGDGDGTITPGTPIAAGAKPTSMAVGNLDNALGTDLAVANYDGGTVSVFLGDGVGGFTPSQTLVTGGRPWSLHLASIEDAVTDPAGNLDLVLVNYNANATVRVYKGVGDGTFVGDATNYLSKTTVPANKPHSVEVADLNGDTYVDVVVANDDEPATPATAATTGVTVLLGDGTGAFPTVTHYPLSGQPNGVVSLHLNNTNPLLDLAVANGTTGNVDVLLSVPTTTAPVASDGTLTAIEDTATNGTLPTATDADGASVLLSYSIVANGTSGTAVITDAATGAYTYTPNADVNGVDVDTFTFKANDGTADSTPATITVTITAVNDIPVRSAGTVSNLTVLEDSGLTSLGLGTLAYGPGATDESAQTLTYAVTAVPAASLGDVVLTDGTTVVSASAYSLAQIQGMKFRTATDAAGGPATFSFTVQDDGGTANSGVDTLTESLTITVTGVNDAPALTAGTVSNLTVLEDSGLTSLGLGTLAFGPGGAADEAAQTLTYAVTAVPSASLGDVVLTDGTTVVSAGAYSLADIQGMKFRTASDAAGGPATFSFTVQDNGGTANSGVDTLTESLTITVTGVNDIPVRSAGTVSNLTVLEDSGQTSLGLGTLAFGPGATDESAQTLTYAVTAVPSASLGDVVLTDGTTVVSAGAYSLAQIQGMKFRTASDAAGGPATFSFTVQDDGGTANGGVDTLTESLTITVTGVNDVPALTAGTVSNLTVLEDSGLTSLGLGTLAYGPGATDESAQTLTYTVTAVPSASLGDVVLTDGTTVVSAGAYSLADIQGMKFRTASNANGGPATFSFTVQDNGGTANSGVDTLTESLTINVTAVNDAPTISGTPATNAVQDTAYSFITPVAASDVDVGGTLTFSINTTPSWASFNTTTGALTGTPTNADVGNTTTGIVISVSDGIAADVSLPAFDLTVSNTNDAPTISGTPATTVAEGSPYSFTPTAGDPDVGDTLTFSITNQPTWASFDTATGALTGTPGSTAVGTTTGIVISVSDATVSVSLPAFNLEVTALDSNADGISDGQAAAIGLDPALTDTDGDGTSDAAEVGGDPANPTDTDGDGIIDALEFGAADANTLGFVVPAPTATTLSLPDLSGDQVTLSGNGAAITANINGTTGLPLYAESDLAVADASFTYPFGVYDFSVAAPAGSATVTLTLPAGTVIPTNAVVRKLSTGNQWQTFTAAVIDRTANTITLTLTDNDGVFDLDATAGIIRDPVGVAVPVTVASTGGGGGGCSLSVDSRRAGFDPILPLMALASLLYLRRQRKQNVA